MQGHLSSSRAASPPLCLCSPCRARGCSRPGASSYAWAERPPVGKTNKETGQNQQNFRGEPTGSWPRNCQPKQGTFGPATERGSTIFKKLVSLLFNTKGLGLYLSTQPKMKPQRPGFLPSKESFGLQSHTRRSLSLWPRHLLSLQARLAVFQSRTRPALALKRRILKERSVSTSCHRSTPASGESSALGTQHRPFPSSCLSSSALSVTGHARPCQKTGRLSQLPLVPPPKKHSSRFCCPAGLLAQALIISFCFPSWLSSSAEQHLPWVSALSPKSQSPRTARVLQEAIQKRSGNLHG